MSRLFLALCFLVSIQVVAARAESAREGRFTRRWISVHPGFNLQIDAQADQFIKLIRRAQKAGYNGVVFGANRLQVLSAQQPRSYFRNAERVRKAAEEANVELIPQVMRINGYSNDLLSNDPNLAPAMPVHTACLRFAMERRPFITRRI